MGGPSTRGGRVGGRHIERLDGWRVALLMCSVLVALSRGYEGSHVENSRLNTRIRIRITFITVHKSKIVGCVKKVTEISNRNVK